MLSLLGFGGADDDDDKIDNSAGSRHDDTATDTLATGIDLR